MIPIERGDVWISCRTTAWGDVVMIGVPYAIRAGMIVWIIDNSRWHVEHISILPLHVGMSMGITVYCFFMLPG